MTSDVHPGDQRFSVEEVGELIELAARLDELAASDGLSYDQLIRVADEVGISQAALERAVVEDRAERRRMTKRTRKQVRRRMRFIRHATVYAVVVSALLLVDALGGGGWWFFYVAAIWGAALALQGTRFLTRKSGPVEQALLSHESRVASPES
jgi:dephospho-CoA kinase